MKNWCVIFYFNQQFLRYKDLKSSIYRPFRRSTVRESHILSCTSRILRLTSFKSQKLSRIKKSQMIFFLIFSAIIFSRILGQPIYTLSTHSEIFQKNDQFTFSIIFWTKNCIRIEISKSCRTRIKKIISAIFI